MKSILCYGDSNTYGFVPGTCGRYKYEERWTGMLQNLLGSEYQVIEEGLNGRTSVFEDEDSPELLGLRFLPVCLKTHMPVNLIIIMLGTNDLKERFHASEKDIANGARVLVEKTLQFINESGKPLPEGNTQILLVSPFYLGEKIKNGTSICSNDFAPESYEISTKLAKEYELVAKKYDISFMDAGLVALPSDVDDLHLTKEGHKKLAEVFYEKVKSIIG